MSSDLDDIDGIGNSIEKELNERGIETVNQLANANLEDLEGIRSAEKIHERAKNQGAIIQSGEDVQTEEENTRHITTGIPAMDRILGDGFEAGHLVGVSGESGAGKTQLVLQCLSSALDYYPDEKAVYIETEPNRFSVQRLKSMTSKDDSYKRIQKIEGHDADSPVDNLKIQFNAYESVRESLDNVSLIVVDSFIANFRLSGKFEGRSTLPERSQIVTNHLQALQSLANQFECPILLTLQVQGNPQNFGGDYSIWGPAVMDHTITHLIHVSYAKGELREAHVKGHPYLPDDSVMIQIPENDSIEAVE